MNEFLLVGGMFLVTFLVRYLPFGLAGSLQIPEPLERALRYVPVAVLMAIVCTRRFDSPGRFCPI